MKIKKPVRAITLTIRLTAEEREALELYALEQDRPMTWCVRTALKKLLNEKTSNEQNH